MDRRNFLQTSLAALAPQAGHHVPEQERAAKPNVLWVFGDQFRAQALASNGDPNARTPNLDRAAVNGVTLAGHVSGFPLCCPFRGSLLTSRYPHECVPGHEYALPEGQKTIANVFNDNGYHTAYFGKWHLAGWHERDGRAAFQSWTGYENNNSQWDCWVHGGQGKSAFHYRLPGYETDELTNLLIRYLKGRQESESTKRRPFFAALSVQPPHNPYVAPEAFMSRYNPEKIELRRNVAPVRSIETQTRRDLAGYYAMIENLDWNYGRIVQTLTELGLLDNTHILFFADHGDSHGSHGQFLKTNPYDESIKTPMILSGGTGRYDGWKNGYAPVVSNHVDIAPTTLGLCGIAKPDWMRGHDYSSRRLAKPPAGPEPDSAYLQQVIPTGHPDSINTPYRGLVTRDGWKYCCFENRSWLMFNLNEDPYEEANLAQNERYKAERKKLIARLKQWSAETNDPFPIPEN